MGPDGQDAGSTAGASASEPRGPGDEVGGEVGRVVGLVAASMAAGGAAAHEAARVLRAEVAALVAATVEQAQEAARRREHLAELLVDGADRPAVTAAARAAGIELAAAYRAVLVPGSMAGRLGERGLVLRRAGNVLALVAAEDEEWLAEVVEGAATIGPSVARDVVASSVRLAERVLPLAVATAAPVRAGDHLAALALTADPVAVAEIRRRRLAALDELRPAQRDRLLETLRSWLRHWGQRGPVAAELFIHPQTVGYRLGQLRSVLGAELDDPQARLEMLLALEADAAPVPGSEGEA